MKPHFVTSIQLIRIKLYQHIWYMYHLLKYLWRLHVVSQQISLSDLPYLFLIFVKYESLNFERCSLTTAIVCLTA